MQWTCKGKEMDAVWERLKGKKSIYIYGAGENGKYLHERIRFLGRKEDNGPVCGFIDGARDKQGTQYLGCRVFSLEEALQTNQDELLILIAVSELNRPNVVKQLVVHGLVEGRDFINFLEFIDTYLPVYAAYGFDKVYHRGVSYIPTRKCVLNCQHCVNFIPFVENPSDDPLEDVKEDLERFFACIDYVGMFSLAGGEIFLHKQYKEMFRYIGGHFRSQIGMLAVTTSTAIMPDDETFGIFKEYGFCIHVSDYRHALPGLAEKYDQFVKKLEEYGIEFILFEDHEWVDLGIFREGEALTEEADKRAWFDACGIPWSYYSDGKLWQCNWAGFTVMAGVREPCETDYYDLKTCTNESLDPDGKNHFVFQKEKRRELMEFGMGYTECGYVEMCAKCNGYLTVNHHYVPAAVQIPRNGVRR